MHADLSAGQRSGRRRTPVRPLLIDGMGTLVSLAAPVPALRRELADRFDLEVSEEEARRALGAEIGFYRAHMGEGRDAAGLAGLRRRCAEVLRGALPPGALVSSLPLDRLTEALLASLRFTAYPDARDALVRARQAGARVVVVSNWDVSLHEVLQMVGLAPLLHGVVTSAAVGSGKPAPAIFRHALGVSGGTPEHALHVGDSLAEDVRGAQACGIPALLLAREGAAETPGAPTDVPVIRSLAELRWP